MSDLERLSPPEFCRFLASQGIRRFFLIPDESSGGVRASHAALEPLARFVGNDERDFDLHEGVFMQVAPETGVLQGAFVHRTCRGQGAGGLRFWRYDTMEDLLRDGLRLARGMTYKSALAGLWWGGGKGVMAEGTGRDPGSGEVRRRIYEEYGEFVTSLKGCYVTAEDVGTSVGDMAAVFSRTRFTSCIPGSLGGSGNPSVPTARGIVHGMEAALEHLGQGGLAGKSVAIQGLGHVGEPLVAFLRDKGVSRIVGSDIDPSREEAIRRGFPDLDVDVRIVARGDCSIFSESVDILSPCATGAVLRPDTIPTIAARVVCGAANNQLQDPLSDDLLLQENGILYMPDFLVNRMGIVTCADEAFGYVDPDPAIERHLGDDWEDSIYNLSLRVLKEAEASGSTPARVALELAEVRSLVHHPIWGHRGAQIIGSLARGDWAA
jgi:glutamate dehydrogenase/leucine dehydrogenase